MRLAIAKFVFATVIFVYWSTLSTASVLGDRIVNYVDLSIYVRQLKCEDDGISLNFSNAVISKIKQDFISSPLITCLNLSDNHIEDIGTGAFNKLPNLTQLFLSNNILHTNSTETDSLFYFEGHDKLEVLVMNRAILNQHIRSIDPIISIYGEYPNLEILSLRKNSLKDLQYFPENILFSDSRFADSTPPTQKIIFPKLHILDLSENAITGNNFMKLLSNTLEFLDLHDNQLESFNIDETKNKLWALNLDNNRLSAIGKWNNYPNLALAGLTNLYYLSVYKNEIKFIESNAFQDSNKLYYLNLSTNNINRLHPETFANLQYLDTLDLSVNELESVPEMSNEMSRFGILYINCNNIKKLISNTFMKMPKLTELLLGENQINEIDVHAFAHLSILNKLDLSRNMLSSLPERWTESLVSLKYLDLSDNKFISLESLSLTSTLPLIEIYLIMNPLEYLNVKYFENLPQNLTINLIKTSNFSIWTRAVRNSCENEF